MRATGGTLQRKNHRLSSNVVVRVNFIHAHFIVIKIFSHSATFFI